MVQFGSSQRECAAYRSVRTNMEAAGNKYLHKKFKKQTSCPAESYADDRRLFIAAPAGDVCASLAAATVLAPDEPEGAAAQPTSDKRVPNLQSTNDCLVSESADPTARSDKPDNQSSISSSSSSSLVDVAVESKEPPPCSISDAAAAAVVAAAGDKSSMCNSGSAAATAAGGKYVCTYCNLACSKPSVLQKHIRAHTNERPYPCVSCGFSFKTRSNLYKHCRSRTHANRVLGTRHTDSLSLSDVLPDVGADDDTSPDDDVAQNSQRRDVSPSSGVAANNLLHPALPPVENRSKPYKPKFHTAKVFFEEETKLKENSTNNVLSDKPNSDLLKMRINDLINKNNSIVNSDEAVVIRRKYLDGNVPNSERPPSQQPGWQSTVDEPLNLTAKNRKRCLSDSENSQKSLIKELLLKNLSADPNLQCQYCRMIFQTVTELEMHKLKYCSATNNNKSGMRYMRSSSVNVATILSQNRSSADDVPSKPASAFSLKSPGPFLGKTRLIDNDKYKTFSFDDNITQLPPKSPNLNKYMIPSPNYPLSPQIKKTPIRLFGGEVKITQTSGETRSFKIESENIGRISDEPHNFMSFESENLVIKSTLQSGGTVLQNKTNYVPKLENLPSPHLIRVYHTNDIISPNLTLPNKFSYDKISQGNIQVSKYLDSPNVEPLKRPLVNKDYQEPNMRNSVSTDDRDFSSNLIDFGKKAAKLLAPNLKTPNLTIPGLPVPALDSETCLSPTVESDRSHLENFVKKQISLQSKVTDLPPQSPTIFNPVNLLVNGKVIRYVPGIPGPVADTPEVGFSNIISTGRLTALAKVNKDTPKSPKIPEEHGKPETPSYAHTFERKTPSIIVEQPEPNIIMHSVKNKMESKDDKLPTNVVKNADKLSESRVEPKQLSPNPVMEKQGKESPKKFIRPNSLPLKPSSVSIKSHHGLTPTMFNQALISPDTPRVAKKYCQQYLNGNYFSYLGLKSSTKSVYCTLNKTQPFYVTHFKKLSMYSEWRQQESKIDSLSVSAYDSRQRQQKSTMAGQAKADLIAHSSYKFVFTDNSSTKEDLKNKNSAVLGGYESNEDYTYIRGRGRGRYVCDQCGIRCKKPSMLKKHIRTHSDDRPYTCQHCNFSFKTKGNLTKHMKSKAHTKKYAETSSSASAQNSVTTSSESDDSDAESSDESTRLQEHEAAHCLLSLAQKNHTVPMSQDINVTYSSPTVSNLNLSEMHFFRDDKFLKNSEQINQVNNSNFVKNKILDESTMHLNAKQHITDVLDENSNSSHETSSNVSQYLGKSSTIRPLTYPYLQSKYGKEDSAQEEVMDPKSNLEKDAYVSNQETLSVVKSSECKVIVSQKVDDTLAPASVIMKNVAQTPSSDIMQNMEGSIPTNIVFRKRKLLTPNSLPYKIQRPEQQSESPFIAMDLSCNESPVLDLSPAAPHADLTFNGVLARNEERENIINLQINNTFMSQAYIITSENSASNRLENLTMDSYEEKLSEPLGYNSYQKTKHASFSDSNSSDQDQSAMQTLAEIAIKQVKLEKNTLAKSVASEYLKLALKSEYGDVNSSDSVKKLATPSGKDPVNEENKNCSICSKNFSKPSQLRLHMNIHYLERPFRCESCSVSFRTKGHLQKHERSASHHNKLSSSPALASSEPRPFKCSDCNIAFRIHGHLAKHLRSKMHIMKLECLAKIPFGLYAELERANSLLTEINTTDGDMCLESLKILARKLFSNDPNKLDQLASGGTRTRDS